MKCAIIAAAAFCGTASADFLIAIPNGFVWDGGSAVRTANGWVGSGWERFPGVNPPWNSIGGEAERVAVQTVLSQPIPAVVMPCEPTRSRPARASARISGSIRVANESVRFSIDPV